MGLLWMRWFAVASLVGAGMLLCGLPWAFRWDMTQAHEPLYLIFHSAFVLSLTLIPWVYKSLEAKPHKMERLFLKLFNWRVLPGPTVGA